MSNYYPITPFEANLCLLMEWTEGTAQEKKKKEIPQMGTGEEEWI